MKDCFVSGLFFLVLCAASYGQSGFSFVEKPAQKKIEVRYNGKVLTNYCYFDSTEKPVLFPVRTVSGVTVTRGFPIAPRKGERTDHPHHVGIWFNHESVNGLDFWNNSKAIAPERKQHYGSIKHRKVVSKETSTGNATLRTNSQWINQKGEVLLLETTEFIFTVEGNDFLIDRRAEIEAVADRVEFKDIKDGLIAIRVARSLEMPSSQQDRFIDSRGLETPERAINNEGVTGMYLNRQGIRGDSVWSSKSEWVQLYGYVRDVPVSVVIIDHPDNPGYPSHWHARGYGLFAANPLGKSVFSNGQEQMNLTLKKGEKATFLYRILIHEGEPLTTSQLDQIMAGFHSQK